MSAFSAHADSATTFRHRGQSPPRSQHAQKAPINPAQLKSHSTHHTRTRPILDTCITDLLHHIQQQRNQREFRQKLGALRSHGASLATEVDHPSHLTQIITYLKTYCAQSVFVGQTPQQRPFSNGIMTQVLVHHLHTIIFLEGEERCGNWRGERVYLIEQS